MQGSTTLSITILSVTTLSIMTQHNDTQYNGTQHNDTQRNNTRHLIEVWAECHYAYCHGVSWSTLSNNL